MKIAAVLGMVMATAAASSRIMTSEVVASKVVGRRSASKVVRRTTPAEVVWRVASKASSPTSLTRSLLSPVRCRIEMRRII